MSRLLQQGFHPDSNNTRRSCSNWELYNGAQSQLWIGNHCTNPFTCFCALRFVFSIVLMCDASYVVRRTSRQTHDISYPTYVRSYDKVAQSTIEAIKINSDLLIELWVDANRIQLKLRSKQLTWSSSQESQLFKTVPNAI